MTGEHFDVLKKILDQKALLYNQVDFFQNDPISIPHRFVLLQDIEIMGLWTALLSWGQRATIIKKALSILELMDCSPYDFIINHQEKDRIKFLNFKHRTFQPVDALYFLEFFQNYYQNNQSLESAFFNDNVLQYPDDMIVEEALKQFRNQFFALQSHLKRTEKHVSTPIKNSACKRLNMFLRWMVRDDRIVDFGLWKSIKPLHLKIPFDIHVARVAKSLKLITDTKSTWINTIKLTEELKKFDSADPVRYDYALFGMGIHKDNLDLI